MIAQRVVAFFFGRGVGRCVRCLRGAEDRVVSRQRLPFFHLSGFSAMRAAAASACFF